MTLPKKIYHYSPNPIDKLSPDFYDQYKEGWPEEGSMKPVGLWISIEENEDDYSWFEWCKDEEFRVENLRHKYAVTIAPEAKILHLKSAEEILKFSIEYAANHPFGWCIETSILPRREYIYMIAWSRVKAKYDGMIISPYQWGARLESATAWYYPWDCSSGCIWNIEKVTLKLESLIDINSLKEPECQEEESEKG